MFFALAGAVSATVVPDSAFIDVDVDGVYTDGVDTSYPTLQDAIDAAVPGEVVGLQTDETTSAQVNAKGGVTVDGNGYTLYANFTKTTNSNNSALGIQSSDVTVRDITFDGTSGTNLHGVNVYQSTGVVLESVTVSNFRSGVVVNGSDVTATDLNASGNEWNSVNVDPGSGVTLPSVFTLNSGNLDDDTQIWSDGANVTSEATVSVSASGYTQYMLYMAPQLLWTNKGLTNAATIASVLYSSIQSAVTNGDPGDTITVWPGTYNESVLVTQPLTIVGTGATKPVLTGLAPANYIVKVDGVTTGTVVLDNLEIDGGGSTRGDNGFDHGVLVNDSGTSGSPVEIKNSTVENIWNASGNGIEVDATVVGGSYALIHNNTVSSFDKRGVRFINSSGKVYSNEVVGDNVDGTSRVQNLVNLWGGSDVEVYENDLHNALTTGGTPTWTSPAIFVSSFGGGGNSTANIHDNEIYNSDSGVIVGSSYAPGDASTATIVGNNFHDLNTGVNFEVNTSSATINGNSFTNVEIGVNNNDEAVGQVVDATENWWGDFSGPTNAINNPDGLGASVYNEVSFDPWYLNPEGTLLSDAVDGETLTSPDVDVALGESGEAYLPAGITTLILGNDSDLDLSGGLDGDEVVLNSGIPGEPIVITNGDLPGFSVTIPDGTTIEGPDGWDGIMAPPTSDTPSGRTPSGFSVGDTVIFVGSSDGTITFDPAVTILLAGVTGPVGYKPAESNTWVQITDVCTDYANPTGAPVGGECAISNGTDTKILTYHFTTFGELNASSQSGSRSKRATPAIPAIPGISPAFPAIPSANSNVAGGLFTFLRHLGLGLSGEDVTALQNRLIAEGVYSGPVTGYFGPLTLGAVQAYQRKMGISDTGFVGPLTLARLNQGLALGNPSSNPLTTQQITEKRTQLLNAMQELVRLLQSQLNTQ